MKILYFSLGILIIFLPFCFANPLSKIILFNEIQDDINDQLQINEDQATTGLDQLKAGIIGGKPTSMKTRPYQVGIIVNGTFEGAGIILDHTWIATLASIVFSSNSSDVKVLAGNENYLKGKSFDVNRIVIHPEFNFYLMENDIALLNLKKNIKLSKTINVVPIAKSHLKDGTDVTLSGWGLTSENSNPQLKKVKLQTVNKDSCKLSYAGYAIPSSVVCAYKINAGACWFDFGDVITAKNNKGKKEEAYGLFSWSKGCALSDYPGIYTDLVSLNPWIVSIVHKKKTRMLTGINDEILNDYSEEIYKQNQHEEEEEIVNKSQSLDKSKTMQKLNAGMKPRRLISRLKNSVDVHFNVSQENNGRAILVQINDFNIEDKGKENIDNEDERNDFEEEIKEDGDDDDDEDDEDCNDDDCGDDDGVDDDNDEDYENDDETEDDNEEEETSEIVKYILENKNRFRKPVAFDEVRVNCKDGHKSVRKRDVIGDENGDNVEIEVVEEEITDEDQEESETRAVENGRERDRVPEGEAEIEAQYISNLNSESVNKYDLITDENVWPYVVNGGSGFNDERQVEEDMFKQQQLQEQDDIVRQQELQVQEDMLKQQEREEVAAALSEEFFPQEEHEHMFVFVR